MIDQILSRPEFADKPPVLLDVGASGAIHRKWRDVAKYSIGIAFDADARDMGYVSKETGGFKKLYVYNSLASDQAAPESDFYLTRSPHCSSSLQPDQASLNNWSFADLFEVEKVVRLKAATLPVVLREIGVEKIDWFKTDSQGTDLRLFLGLGETIDRTLVAEFEPGIIDAYQGEDKLWSLLACMDRRPFWMTSLDVKGVERMERRIHAERLSARDRKYLPLLLKASPCWGEVCYMNTFGDDNLSLDKRDFLLGWVFAVVERQYGFALELAAKGRRRFGDGVFEELADHALKLMRRRYWRAPLVMIVEGMRRLANVLSGL